MDIWGYLGVLAFVIIAVVVAVAFARNANIGYRIGKGMFEHSDNNLDEDKEFSDKEYYDGDNGLFK